MVYVFQLTLVPLLSTDEAADEVYDKAEGYLAALMHHGQVYGEPIMGWVGRRLQVTTKLAGPDAYLPRSHSKWGLRELRGLRRVCKRQPQWKPVSNAARRHKPVPNWRDESSLFLFTHLLDDASPVCAGSTGEPVPIYKFPMDDSHIANMNGWADCYRFYDKLWLASGELEVPAYRQIAEPNSELSRRGREAADEIERCTGLPTYYYLGRFHGRRNARYERTRKCPGCGRAWACKREAPVFKGITGFDFRCDSCRLVSDIPTDDWGGPISRIGEWRRGTRATARRRRGN